MLDPLPIADVVFSVAPEHMHNGGLLGWVSFDIADALTVSCISVRRTEHGLVTLSFPVRRDRSGRQHPIMRPVDSTARRIIEAAVFDAIGLGVARGGAS